MGAYDFLPQPLRQTLVGPLSLVLPGSSARSKQLAGVGRSPDDRFIGYMRTMYGHISKGTTSERSFRSSLSARDLEPAYLTPVIRVSRTPFRATWT